MVNKNNEPPQLSVIVTIVDGGKTLERCLTGLSNQQSSHLIEVVIPYDHTSMAVKALSSQFPEFNFVDLGLILGGMQPKNPLEHHLFYDTRRTGGLKCVKGELVAILEDRGVPEPDWASKMIDLHHSHADAVIGGAIENGIDHPYNWAVFFCDFGRYQPPFTESNPEFISDTNICYKKQVLDKVSMAWETKYDEVKVNNAVRELGETLRLSELPRTTQLRSNLTIPAMLNERLHWGRNYGRSRCTWVSFHMRMILILATPIIPLLVFIRHLRRQFSIGRNTKEFLTATPMLILLLISWSVGECIGYFEGK